MSQTRTICEEPPPGFRGLDPHAPVAVYRRHLPHWRQDGAAYFVTFRLADALPREAVEALKAEREVWLAAHPEFDACRSGFRSRPTSAGRSGSESRPVSDRLWLEYERLSFASLERWLDAGHGSKALAKLEAQAALAEEFAHFDGERYALGCYAIMPNHVHAVVRPLENVGRDRNPDAPCESRDSDPDLRCYRLEDIVGSWKRRSARQIGTAWQDETYDRIVRNSDELNRTISYIGKNPVKAKCEGVFWICADWENVGRDRNPGPTQESRDSDPGLR